MRTLGTLPYGDHRAQGYCCLIRLPALYIWLTLLASFTALCSCVHARPQNAEIFTMTYGSIVRQLITDLDDIELVNKQLDAMCGCRWMPAARTAAPVPSSCR